MINNKPNIFEFATKELSQDAVFCYILDCFNDPKKRKISTDFLTLVEFNGIEDIKDISIKRQEDHSDIKAIVSFLNGTQKIILFEDKVFTSLHDNQLERYKNDTIKRHKCSVDDIEGIFFKIGKPTIWEKINCEKINFKMLDYSAFAEYLSNTGVNDPILRTFSDFYQFRVSFCEKIDKMDFNTVDAKTLDEVLSERHGQRRFTEWFLRQVFEGTKIEYNERKQYDVNNYGKPCTQYTFIFNPDKTTAEKWDLNESEFPKSDCNCFFRIEKNSKGWYISIKRYFHDRAQSNQLDEHQKMRLSLLDKLGIAKDNASNKKAEKELNLILLNFTSIKDVKKLVPLFKTSVNFLFENSLFI